MKNAPGAGFPKRDKPAEREIHLYNLSMLDLEVAPQELKTILAAEGKLFLLDVREPWETKAVQFPGAYMMPMGEIPARAYNELDPDQRTVVICHHGVRSLSVANWLRNQGFEHAQSLRGGIDAWSRDVDPTVARY
jgi:rhodanese-related sulfurtransferase